MTKARHAYQLKRTGELYWSVDFKQCGVGKASGGNTPPMPEAHVKAEPETFSFSYAPHS